jgi:ribosomal protein S16
MEKWVIEQRTEADERTGTYDPIPKAPIDGEGKHWKDIKLDSARAKYWLGVGAQPSDPAWRLLSMVCSTLHSGCVGDLLNLGAWIWLKRRYIWNEKQEKNAN